jgi:hypothetical protein
MILPRQPGQRWSMPRIGCGADLTCRNHSRTPGGYFNGKVEKSKVGQLNRTIWGLGQARERHLRNGVGQAQGMASETPHPSPLAEPAVCHQTPKVGAVYANPVQPTLERRRIHNRSPPGRQDSYR